MTVVCLATIVLVAASALAGAGVWRIAGLGGLPHVAPAVGAAALMILVETAVRLPGRAWTAVVAAAIALAAALASATVRRQVRAGLALGAPVAAAALLLLVLPWLVSGHFGLLAMGNNNDTGSHLVTARWLAHGDMPAGDTLAAPGYPVGPHALAATLSALGLPLEQGFSAVMVIGPLIAALAALDALPRLRPLARCGLALLAGLVYMSASYYAQAAFKETLVGALALAFALTLPAVARAARGGRRAAARASVAPAVLLAGTVHVMSWPGLLWPLATLAAWGALALRASGLGVRAALAAARPGLAGGAAALVVLLAPEAPRIVAFQSSSFAHEPDQGLGNLAGPVPPWEALGVWLHADFRFGTALPVLAAPLIVAAAGLAAAGAATWWRSGERALLGALVAGWSVWVALTLFKNPYNAAKGLAVLAPLMGVAIATGAVVAWRGARRPRAGGESELLAAAERPAMTFAVLGWVPGPGRRPVAATARRVVVAAVLAAAAASSFLVLRDASVGPEAHHRELRELAGLARDGRTLFLDNDDFTAWDLYGVEVWRPPLLYAHHTVTVREAKAWSAGQPFDLDSVPTATLNRFRYVITARNPAASTPPAGMRAVRRTASFVLWERTRTLAPRRTLDEGWQPGAVLDCSTPGGRALSRRRGTAIVRSAPVVGGPAGWVGEARDAGSQASRRLWLPAGRWDLSLQYVSRNPIHVRTAGGDVRLPATLDRLGPLFAAGSVTSRGGDVPVTVRVESLGSLARALGAAGRTRALDSFRHQPLGVLVATRHGERPRSVPLRHACGRYVDAYRLDRAPAS